MDEKAGTKPPDMARELAALTRMTVKQLREKYLAMFGEPTVTGNRTWLVRRIAWRVQTVEGDLSERAQPRATELARGADLRLMRRSPAARRSAIARVRSAGVKSAEVDMGRGLGARRSATR